MATLRERFRRGARRMVPSYGDPSQAGNARSENAERLSSQGRPTDLGSTDRMQMRQPIVNPQTANTLLERQATGGVAGRGGIVREYGKDAGRAIRDRIINPLVGVFAGDTAQDYHERTSTENQVRREEANQAAILERDARRAGDTANPASPNPSPEVDTPVSGADNQRSPLRPTEEAIPVGRPGLRGGTLRQRAADALERSQLGQQPEAGQHGSGVEGLRRAWRHGRTPVLQGYIDPVTGEHRGERMAERDALPPGESGAFDAQGNRLALRGDSQIQAPPVQQIMTAGTRARLGAGDPAQNAQRHQSAMRQMFESRQERGALSPAERNEQNRQTALQMAEAQTQGGGEPVEQDWQVQTDAQGNMVMWDRRSGQRMDPYEHMRTPFEDNEEIQGSVAIMRGLLEKWQTGERVTRGDQRRYQQALEAKRSVEDALAAQQELARRRAQQGGAAPV